MRGWCRFGTSLTRVMNSSWVSACCGLLERLMGAAPRAGFAGDVPVADGEFERGRDECQRVRDRLGRQGPAPFGLPFLPPPHPREHVRVTHHFDGRCGQEVRRWQVGLDPAPVALQRAGRAPGVELHESVDLVADGASAAQGDESLTLDPPRRPVVSMRLDQEPETSGLVGRVVAAVEGQGERLRRPTIENCWD